MKPSMIKKLATLSDRLEELNRLMSSEGATNNMDNYRKITQEHAEITPIVEQYRLFEQTEADMNEAQKMLSDPDMKEFALEEIEAGKATLEKIEAALQKLLLPKDPNDDKNLFLEIRAGTGGDESGLFCGDLYRMYSRYAERQKWKVEIMSANESEVGGYKEIIVKIEGYGAYSKLKFESGGHRVQRVPDTETQGRIHTSACTVAVLPEADEVSDVVINPADIRIDT
jgi:peptide chain release factor 1